MSRLKDNKINIPILDKIIGNYSENDYEIVQKNFVQRLEDNNKKISKEIIKIINNNLLEKKYVENILHTIIKELDKRIEFIEAKIIKKEYYNTLVFNINICNNSYYISINVKL